MATMRPRTLRFFFGRVNLRGGPADRNEFLRTAIHSHRSVEVGQNFWSVYETCEIKPDGLDIVYVYLAKYRSAVDEEVVDEGAGDLSAQSVENRVLAKSLFFLDLNSHIIPFQPSGSQIEATAF